MTLPDQKQRDEVKLIATQRRNFLYYIGQGSPDMLLCTTEFFKSMGGDYAKILTECADHIFQVGLDVEAGTLSVDFGTIQMDIMWSMSINPWRDKQQLADILRLHINLGWPAT